MARRIVLLISVGSLVLAGCPGEREVKFGAVLPLTESASIYGQSIEKGVRLAFEEAVSQPDTSYLMSLSVTDSGSDPEKAARLLAEQYKNGAVAVIGGVTTAEALEMIPVADGVDRILVSPSASSPELTGISKNFFRVFPSDFLEGTKMGNFAAQTLELENAVVLAKQEPYARGVQEVFKSEFERNGGEVVEVIEFPPNTSDFSGLIARVMTLGPSAAYLGAYASELVPMIRELRRRGFDGTILTTSAFAAPEAIAEAGRVAEGIYLTQAVFEVGSDDPKIRHFVDTYREKYGLDPDLYSAHGYDAMMVLVEALHKGGPVPSEFWKGMRAIRDFQGVTGTVQFDEKGDVQKFPRVYVIHDGRLVDYETEVERRRRELLERLRRLQEERERARSRTG